MGERRSILVASCASDRPRMFQVSSRDETFLIFNAAMTLRHSRKRDKIYLKQLFFLRNFLNLLQLYRGWKFRNCPNATCAVKWQRCHPTLEWNSNFYLPAISTTVIFRFYRCQLTATSVIKSPRLFFLDTVSIDDDNAFDISFGRETLRRNFSIVCERRVDNDSLNCGTANRFCWVINELISRLFQVKC